MKYYRWGSKRTLKLGRFYISWWRAKYVPVTWQEQYQTYGDMERIVP